MIHLQPCACPPGKMSRVHRSAWMRLVFPSRALYQCGSCGGQFLASLRQQADLGLRAHSERVRSAHGPMGDDESPSPSPAG